MARLQKSFAVFDCDAHVNDPEQIWEYVPSSKADLVKSTYWRDDNEAWLNGTMKVIGGGSGEFAPLYNPACVGGPQMSKKVLRKLMLMSPLDNEQRDYLLHRGAFDPEARCRDLDLMGIDQVLVIPTDFIANLPYATNSEGVDVLCRAYNDWLKDWCSAEPDRLFGAALLPLQDPVRAAAEVKRAAELGHRVALIRPMDARGAYPNDISTGGWVAQPNFDMVFKALEETGVVLGMHTFPARRYPHPLGPGHISSPGELCTMAGCDSQTISFVNEMLDWLAQVLLAGFLDRYPRLKMAIFESNSQWLPYHLDTCDRLFKLYAKERAIPYARRLPSEAFNEQCVISFESDEGPVFRQWRYFEDIGIWASDAYHHDGADAWSAIRNMTTHSVPDPVQEKLLGGNARHFYGIEPTLFVTEEPRPIDRPAWFPAGPELEEWASIVARPRRNAARLRELGLDPESALARLTGSAREVQ